MVCFYSLLSNKSFWSPHLIFQVLSGGSREGSSFPEIVWNDSRNFMTYHIGLKSAASYTTLDLIPV